MTKKEKIYSRSSRDDSLVTDEELSWRKKIIQLFKKAPIPDDEILYNLGLFQNRQTVSRFIFMHEMYKRVLNVPGIVTEFGTRWGQTSALFHSFRGMYEPYNHTRKIVAFDTFEGLKGTQVVKDGKASFAQDGAYNVTEGYEGYLKEIFDFHQSQSPLAHMEKFVIIKGDAKKELPKFLKKNPHTLIALAYFDMDLYEPTIKGLEAINKNMTVGSFIVFDEGHKKLWSEKLAIKEFIKRHKNFKKIVIDKQVGRQPDVILKKIRSS